MKCLLILIVVLGSLTTHAQVNEDFEDETLGNSPDSFTPIWVGDNGQFILIDEAGDKQLRSAAGDLTSPLEYAISTPSSAIYEASWEFFVNLKFGTSGSNYVDFFLVSDNSDLTNSQNGYFIRIGDTEDWIAFHKIEDGISTANSTPLISTTESLVNGSSNNPFRIRMTRNASGLWELLVDEDDTGSFVSIGTVTDIAIESSSHLGILIVQSSASAPSDNHFFDDFVVTGGAIPDTTPPTIQSTTVISSTEVDVLFSENIDQTTAETTSNYSIDGSVTVSSETVDGSNSALVHLVTSTLTNGETYTITINNVEDENGNAIAANSQSSFEYLVIEEAQAGDVVVNEFYASPSSDSVIPDEEFIELLNVSDKFIQLEDWTFSDASGTSSSFTSFVLDPGEYVILTNTGNGTLFNSYGDVLEVANFRALNNGGDDITITNSLDTDIYTVTYTSSTSGISTELINPNGPDYSLNNYGESTDSDGGTPGEENSIFDDTPDTTLPTIQSIAVVSSTKLDVTFSETIQTSTANISSNYTIDGVISVSTAERDADNNSLVHLTVSELVSGDVRTLTVNNVTDLSGNAISDNSTFDFEYILTETAAEGDIIVNEFYAAPNAEITIPNVEFVELFNRSEKFISLESWTLSDQSGSSSSFGSFIIRPDSFVILTETDNGVLFDAYGDWLEVSNFPSLNNGGDSIIISDASSEKIHEIKYASSTSGTTTEIINPNGPDYSFRNYGLSTDSDGGTPGSVNSIFDDTPDTTAPSLDSVAVISQTQLEVYFDEPLEETSAENLSNYTIDGSITVISILFDELKPSLVVLNVSDLVSGEVHKLTVNGVTDLSGNAIESGEIEFRYFEVEEAVEGDVVINEFYASPNSESQLPNREFIELFNRSEKYIDIENWIYGDGSDVSSAFSSFILEPDSFLILTTNSGASSFDEYGDVIGVGSFLSLSNGGDSIIISNASSEIIHEIKYVSSTSGITTELINPNGPDYSFRNYGLSTAFDGGTPGSLNSIFDDTPDTVSPSLDSVAVISQTQLEVYFNEPLEEFSTENLANYTIDGDITVSSIQFDELEPSLVVLNVSNLVSGEVQKLTVNGVTDLSGNALLAAERTFRYIKIEEAIEGDVVINEFYASPNSESQLPNREFIELFNRSEKYIDVVNWKYSDASDTSSVFSSFILEPDSFLILTTTSGAASFDEYGDVIGVGSFRTLSSNDQIIITSASDVAVHQISYTEVVSGISTELINPNGPDYSFRNYGLSTDPNGGTPGFVNSIFDDTPDTEAPIIESIDVISSTELSISFNEPLNKTTAENITNYTIDEDISILSAVLLDTANNVVQLSVSALPSAEIRVLTINNVTDLSGNAINSNSTIEFEYLATEAALSGDILINEFLADPFDNNDDFIELWNVSEKYIDLTGWKIRDNAATSVGFSSFIIRPNEFVIIYDEDATIDYASFGNALSIPSLTLNNTNDQIELLSAASLSIAFVAYTDQPDEGISSELINPNDPCISALSYDASVDVSGNTAGSQNSVFDETPDTSQPMITSYSFDGDLTVNFSESMNIISLQNGNYQIQGLTINQVRVTENLFSVEISFAENLEQGTLYELSVSDVADCWGNVIQSSILSFGVGRAPKFNEILITEIMADPDPALVLPDREYIELYNATNDILNLEGVSFSDESSSTILPSITINPNSYLALTTTTGADEFLDGALGVSSFPSLSNSGEQLVLSLNGELLFSVTYDKAWHSSLENEIGGVSLEMIDISSPCSEQNNWTSSSDTRRGTPGKMNAVSGVVSDNFPPEVIAVTAISEDSIRIDFNEKVNPTTIDLVNVAFQPQLSIVNVGSNYLSPKSLFIVLNESLVESRLYNLTLSNVSDCNGNASAEQRFDFALPSTPSDNQILLSELLFNPYTNGVDFVELYNNSDSYLNLKNWQLANLTDDEVDNQREISSDQLVFEPRSFIAISINSDLLFTNYPKGNRESFFQMESLPNYANTEGTVILLNQDSEEVERFTYSDDFHYGLLNSLDGVSLERISYSAVNNEDNWRSASSTVGFATPGNQNSQSFENQTPKGTIEAEPKVFLPGNSGSGRDFTLISYQLETVGQFANVNIYDQSGRLVKTLAEGMLLSNAGFIRWDGTSNNGSLAKLGYHIILFEIYDSTGNSQILKETVVVGRDF